VRRASFSPDSEMIATGSGDGFARIWETRTGKPLTPPMVHNDAITSVVFSPDGRRLAVTCDGQSATVWNVRSGKREMSLLHSGGMYNAEFSPDGRFLATSGDKGTRFWDSATGEAISPYLRNSPVRAQAWYLRFAGTSGSHRTVTAWLPPANLHATCGFGHSPMIHSQPLT
jgi:WD40 repeat protein